MRHAVLILTLIIASLARGQESIEPNSTKGEEVFDQAIIDTALKEVGVTKQVDYESDRVRVYIEETCQDFNEYYKDGWCNAFVSWVLKQNGYKYASLNTYEEVNFFFNRVEKPKIGDIVILNGHIGFYYGDAKFAGLDGGGILLLGGNQGHKVCVLPIAKSHVKYYLEPVKAPVGWTPSRHLSTDAMNSYNLLDDKGYIADLLNKATKITPPGASQYPF